MIWLFGAVAALLVIGIAVFAVNATTRGLARSLPVSVYDLAEATDFVCERLPGEVAERLDRDDVESLLAWNLTWLRSRGLATFGRVDLIAEDAARDATGPIVADEDDAVDALIERAEYEGIPVDPVDVVVVLDLDALYLRAIGAVGEAVPEPLEEGGNEPEDGAGDDGP
ncbi:MAG: hypothetical protein RIE08_07750 [Acidimicrobiales bacterium]